MSTILHYIILVKRHFGSLVNFGLVMDISAAYAREVCMLDVLQTGLRVMEQNEK